MAAQPFIAGLLLFCCGLAQAWGPHGHQTVGGIADQLLAGSNTAKQLRSILGSNLQTAAVWADCAKGVEQKGAGAPLAYDGSGPYPECDYYENAASQKAMEDFVRRNAKNCYGNSSDEVCRHKSYHYTDVSTFATHYAKTLAGTSDHDLISAIDACIVVLKGGKSPPPFDIRGKKEALRLLTHYIGDLHQPLHVVSVYLDKAGQVVDPDAGHFDAKTSTKGGNTILDGGTRLHSEWDGIPGRLATQLLAGDGATAARLLPATPGPIDGWAETWAGDTIKSSKPVFTPLKFGAQSAGQWPATHMPSYAKEREALQRQQIVKAGARLAELLRAIWP